MLITGPLLQERVGLGLVRRLLVLRRGVPFGRVQLSLGLRGRPGLGLAGLGRRCRFDLRRAGGRGGLRGPRRGLALGLGLG